VNFSKSISKVSHPQLHRRRRDEEEEEEREEVNQVRGGEREELGLADMGIGEARQQQLLLLASSRHMLLS